MVPLERPSIVLAAGYNACEITLHRLKQLVVSVCGLVPVAVIVLVFPSIVHIPALLWEHYYYDTCLVGSTLTSTYQQRHRLGSRARPCCTFKLYMSYQEDIACTTQRIGVLRYIWYDMVFSIQYQEYSASFSFGMGSTSYLMPGTGWFKSPKFILRRTSTPFFRFRP